MSIRIGTCSWKYDSWKGIVYPNLDNINYLEYYSKLYDTVEIDQWFWSLFDSKKILLPNTSDVISYSNSVPENFKFTIKIPNSITLTHFYNKEKNSPLIPNPYFLNTELFNKFIDILAPMKNKIGLLMFQFEYLNKQKLSGLNEFIDLFENFFNSISFNFNFGIEIRNPNFLNKNFFLFLKRNKLSMVFLQGYYMPNIWEIFYQFQDELVSPLVIRLHGKDRSGIEEKSKGKWNKIIEPQDDEISKIIEMIKLLDEKQVDIYLNVNNHYEGSAPLTIKKIKALMHS